MLNRLDCGVLISSFGGVEGFFGLYVGLFGFFRDAGVFLFFLDLLSFVFGGAQGF